MNSNKDQLIETIEDGFVIVEAFGSDSDIEFLKNDAIGLAGATGSVGITAQMCDFDGNVKALVKVARVAREVA